MRNSIGIGRVEWVGQRFKPVWEEDGRKATCEMRTKTLTEEQRIGGLGFCCKEGLATVASMNSGQDEAERRL